MMMPGVMDLNTLPMCNISLYLGMFPNVNVYLVLLFLLSFCTILFYLDVDFVYVTIKEHSIFPSKW